MADDRRQVRSIAFVVMRLIAVLLLVLHPTIGQAIAIDNGIDGNPEITCSGAFVGFRFRCRNPFGGHVYVKGQYHVPACNADASLPLTSDGNMVVSFDTCGVRRTRSANPKGVLVSVTIVVMFHQRFVTKIDRAYHVQCFYMEAEKTVTFSMDVSMLSTIALEAQAAMPTCRYEVLDSRTGLAIRYAKIGDPVHHRWTCEGTTQDTYCMVVHSCQVDDGAGSFVTLIDVNGCSQDNYLLSDLQYYDDLTVGQDSHVFKITVAPREPGFKCPRPSCQPASPYQTPEVPSPPEWYRRRPRQQRMIRPPTYNATNSVEFRRRSDELPSAVVDVDSNSITVFDLDSDDETSRFSRLVREQSILRTSFCMPKSVFAAYTFFSALVVLICLIVVTTISCRRLRNSKHTFSNSDDRDEPINIEADSTNANSAYVRFFGYRLRRFPN